MNVNEIMQWTKSFAFQLWAAFVKSFGKQNFLARLRTALKAAKDEWITLNNDISLGSYCWKNKRQVITKLSKICLFAQTGSLSGEAK
jgi:hypothetical protein